MRKLITLLVFLLPLLVSAQRFSMNLNGGLLPKTGDNAWNYHVSGWSYTYYKRKNDTWSGALRFMLSFGAFNTGVGFEVGSYQAEIKLVKNVKNFDYANSTLLARSGFGVPNLFCNVKQRLFGPVHLYAGAMAGYMMHPRHGEQGVLVYNAGLYSLATEMEVGKSGFVYGAQAGALVKLSRHFSLNAEAAVRKTRLYFADYPVSATSPQLKGDLWYYPITIGIKYRFFGRQRENTEG